MTVVLYERESSPVFQALAAGCRAIEHEHCSVVWQRPGLWRAGEAVPGASVVIVHGLPGNGLAIREMYRALRVPVWIVDCPRLRAEPNAHGFFLDSLHWLPEANGRPVVADPVIENRRSEIVLVCGQKPGDMAHGMDARSIEAWARETVARLRASSELPIVYRPHPLNENNVPADGLGADEISDPRATSLRDELARAARVAVYNSTVGWDAIAAGVPVEYTADPALVSFAGAFDGVGDPLAARAAALARAAATQWTLDEMASGLAFRVAALGEAFPSREIALVDSPKRQRRARVA